MFPKLIQPEIKEKCDETYTLTEYVESDANTHHAGGKREHKRGEEDEEEEETAGGGKNVHRCANQ